MGFFDLVAFHGLTCLEWIEGVRYVKLILRSLRFGAILSGLVGHQPTLLEEFAVSGRPCMALLGGQLRL